VVLETPNIDRNAVLHIIATGTPPPELVPSTQTAQVGGYAYRSGGPLADRPDTPARTADDDWLPDELKGAPVPSWWGDGLQDLTNMRTIPNAEVR